MIDTADRRLLRAAQDLVRQEADQPGTQVTVVLPRRSYSPLIGRLLHDRTADKIAAVVSRIPNAAATIVPFDVQSRLEVLHARQVAQAERVAAAKKERAAAAPPAGPDAAVTPAGPDAAAAGRDTPGTGTAGAREPRPGTPRGGEEGRAADQAPARGRAPAP